MTASRLAHSSRHSKQSSSHTVHRQRQMFAPSDTLLDVAQVGSVEQQVSCQQAHPFCCQSIQNELKELRRRLRPHWPALCSVCGSARVSCVAAIWNLCRTKRRTQLLSRPSNMMMVCSFSAMTSGGGDALDKAQTPLFFLAKVCQLFF